MIALIWYKSVEKGNISDEFCTISVNFEREKTKNTPKNIEISTFLGVLQVMKPLKTA